jgi:RecJ-like exonuclease
MKQQCPDCASRGVFGVGNGKCSKCYGGGKVGTIANDIAGGKGSCPRCHGTGRCPTCGGSGLVSGSTAPARPHAHDELNPFDDKVAVRVHCPKCGALAHLLQLATPSVRNLLIPNKAIPANAKS